MAVTGWSEARGVSLEVRPDGTTSEFARAEARVEWWDVDGVLHDVAAPFDGEVIDVGGRTYLIPQEGDDARRPGGGAVHGGYDDDVVDEICLQDCELLRTTSVVLDGGEMLARTQYRYRRSDGPEGERPFDPSSVPAPRPEDGRRVEHEVPADVRRGLERRAAEALALAPRECRFMGSAACLIRHGRPGEFSSSDVVAFPPVPPGLPRAKVASERFEGDRRRGEKVGDRDLLHWVGDTFAADGTPDIEGSRAVGLVWGYHRSTRELRVAVITGGVAWGMHTLPVAGRVELVTRLMESTPEERVDSSRGLWARARRGFGGR